MCVHVYVFVVGGRGEDDNSTHLNWAIVTADEIILMKSLAQCHEPGSI